MTSIKNYINQFKKFFTTHIFTMKFYDDYHKRSVIKLVAILIITIYVGNNFKLNSHLLKFLFSNCLSKLNNS